MSAIWGNINWKETSTNDIRAKMDIPYIKRCKIDGYRYVENEYGFFSCGLQYLTNEAKLEVLPIYDKENETIFNADCILDNRDEVIQELLDCSSLHIPKELTLSSSPYSRLCELPDGSLIYLLYLAFGIDCLKHIRGMFTIAIYDKKAQTIYLAADQVSSRSLYYYNDKDGIFFSTLLDPIKLAGHNEQNELYIKDYLCASGLVPNLVSDESPIKDVYKVLPGKYLEISHEGIKQHTYWELGDAKKFKYKKGTIYNSSMPEYIYSQLKGLKTAEEYSTAFNKIYTDTVRDNLRTIDNVAISMSSGYDSASIGSIAADLLAEKNEKLYVYTYVPYEAPMDEHVKGYVYDETKNVEEIAALHPNMLTHFLHNNGKNCYEYIDEHMEFMEIPYKAFINLPSLCEVYENAVKDNCKVVLTGQNGNFTVSYGYIHKILYDLYRKKDLYHFIKYLNNYCLHEHLSRKKSFRSYISNFKFYDREDKKKEEALTIDNPFVSNDISENYSYSERIGISRPSFIAGYVDEKMYHKEYLACDPCYSYFGEFDTKLSLKYGIILRDATRDIRLLSFCNYVPYKYFAYNGIPRYFIYSTMKKRLPDSILDNWSRYGVQNSDWINRVNRDYNRVIGLLTETFNSDSNNKYIATKHIEDYMSYIKSPIPFQENDNFIYLSIIYLYKKYLEKESSLSLK